MQIQTIILASIYTLLAIIQVFVGIAVIVGQKNKRNRYIISVYLFSLSLVNMMIPLFLGNSTLTDQIWITARMILMMANGFLLGLFVIAVLRPSWTDKKWLLGILITFVALPFLAFGADVLNISEGAFGISFIGDIPNGDITIGNVLGAIDLGDGPLAAFYKIATRLVIPAISIFSFTISFLDRKERPANSRSGLIFGLATLSAIALILQGNLNSLSIVLFTTFQVILTGGVSYISLAQEHETLTLENFQQFLGNWPMFNKLMLAVIAVVFPGILLLSLTSVIFLQSNFTALVGEDLQTLAQAQQDIIQSKIAQEIQSLYNLSNEQLTTTLVASRLSTYQGRTENEIFQQLRQAERTWQQNDDNNQFVLGILSSTRSSHLQDFIQLAPLHQSIIIADIHGGLITATDREQVFDQSRKEWWVQVIETQHPYVNITDENEVFYLEIAVPVQADGNPFDIEGVMMSRYDLTEIIDDVYNLSIGDSGGLSIYTQNKVWIHPHSMHSHDVPINSLRNPELDWEILEENQLQKWSVTDYNGENSLVAWAPFDIDLAATGNLDWVMVSYKSTGEALAPISNMRWATLAIGSVLLIGSVILTNFLARLIIRPLVELTETAKKIIGGDRTLKAKISGTDEIGTLASSFNQVTAELNQVVASLESTIEERTEALEQRALQLETSALVAQEAASIRNLEELLTVVTDLITERFGFYHAGIFLVDESKEYAVLRAANSSGGGRMLARGHKLQIGKVGVVGYAAGVGQSRTAQDVGADVVYYDNPDMPDTRSELAMPLKVRDQVIGVLDVQSTRPNAFNREDVQVLETLADQIALAIDNTRLLESSQRALTELQYLYGQRATDAWRQRLENKPIELHYDPTGFSPQKVRETTDIQRKNSLIQNIVFRGQVIGAIELDRDDIDEQWTVEEQTLVAEIIEQAALALENARLVDQIRFRSDQIQLLQEVTSLSAGLLNEQDLLKQVAVKLQQDLDIKHINIVTLDAGQHTGQIAMRVSENNVEQVPSNQQTIDIKDNEIILEVIQSRRTIVIYDLANDIRTSEALYYQNFHEAAYAIVVVPLIARGEVIGLIELSVKDEDRTFEIDEITLLDQIGTQVATALDSTRLFTQTSQRAERERLVADITNKVRASNDPETIIQTAVQELQQALGVKHAQIVMENGSSKNGQAKIEQKPTINKTEEPNNKSDQRQGS